MQNLTYYKNKYNLTFNETENQIIKKLPKDEMLASGRSFLDKCLDGILINNKSNSYLSNNENKGPLISVIIPVYNCEKKIKAAIRSVQNQNYQNFEIILVNDFSKDNSSKVIEEMQKEDNRIKLLNNKKNMGILYSRSIAALESKGKYIFALDNDDLFFDSDILDIYKEAEINDIDIVSFSAIDGNHYHCKTKEMREDPFHKKEDNLIVVQPQLSYFPITKHNNTNVTRLYDPHIWGKCVKGDIYRRAVNVLGEQRYSVFNCWNEDITILMVICKLSKNYKHIKKFGIFHYCSRKTATFTQTRFTYMNTSILFIELIFDLLKNEFKKLAAIEAVNIRRSFVFYIKDKTLFSYFKATLNKLIESEFIGEEYKNQIRTTYKGIFF